MKRNSQYGSTLLEALIAILIFSAGILAIVGLQAAAMKNTTQAKARIDASLIADERLGNIWIDTPNMTNYEESETPLAALPNGKRTTTINGDQVTVVISWQMPGETSPNTYQSIARITINP